MQPHEEHDTQGNAAFDQLVSEALEAYRLGQEAFAVQVAHFDSWSMSEERLSFTAQTGESKHFGVIPIGSYLPGNESWAWAWANEAFTNQQRLRASAVRQLASDNGYKIFNNTSFRVPSTDLGELCALARRQLGAVAVFNDKSGNPWVYYAVLAGSQPDQWAAV